MKALLGIDIGTSKVATVILDAKNHDLLASASRPTKADLPTTATRSEQDVRKITDTVHACVNDLDQQLRNKVTAIGVTGQMHGVLLWDNADCSPLFTWKDRRGSEDGFLEKIQTENGLENLRDGFGITTLAWLAARGELSSWTCSATIHDFVAARMCGLSKPVTDPTDSASWGGFDIQDGKWLTSAISKLGIPGNLLPEVVPCGTVAGRLTRKAAELLGVPEGVPVTAAIGDNQASILATAVNPEKEVYLTIGTGAQLSVVANPSELLGLQLPDTMECRPFPDKKCLAVAAPLCGGQSIVWLVNVCRNWMRGLELGEELSDDRIYRRIDSLGIKHLDTSLRIKPNFLGERHDLSLRGSIGNIDFSNFTLGDISAALALGVAENLKSMLPEQLLTGRETVIGSGNAIRKLEVVRAAIEKVFGLPLKVSELNEEAAQGAAILALRS